MHTKNSVCMQSPNLSAKVGLQLKKKTEKTLGRFQNFLENFLCRHQNAGDTISICGKCVASMFFSKNKNSFFYHQTAFIRIEQPQNISLYLFSTIFVKL